MKARFLLLLGSLMLTGTVYAEISYNYVEVGFGTIAVDVPAPLDGDGTGPLLKASYVIKGPFTAFLGASQMDFSKDNITLDDVKVGLGWHHALGPNASTFFDVAYLRTNVSVTGQPDYDQDGYGMTLGYRAENRSPWEFIGTIDYVNVESGVEFGGGMSLMYDVTRRFSIAGGVSYFDQSIMTHLGARYSLNWRP